MNGQMIQFLYILIISIVSTPSYSALISVTGPQSFFTGTTDSGGSAAIISAPTSVNDDQAFNVAQQGFDEQQNVTLSRDIDLDNGLTLTSGRIVSSHMIFLNSATQDKSIFLGHRNVIWTFDEVILGVMSNFNASFEVASSDILGSSTTTYPLNSTSGRGLEPGTFDSYVINSPYSITVSMGVTEPGDWIRIVTAIPEPSSILLMALGLLGLRFKFKRR